MDLSALTTEELMALQQGDYSKLSDKALNALQSSSKPSDSKKRDISFLSQLLGRFGNSATAGLVNPVAAGLSSVIDEGLQAIGTIPERSIGEAYDYYSGLQKERDKQFQSENPASAMTADILGLLAPGGAFSQAAKVGQKGATALKLGSKGAGILSKAAEGLVRGGVGNALYGQVASDIDTPLKDRFLKAVIDFAIGGAPDAAISGGTRTISKIAEKGLDANIPQRIYASATGLGKEGAKNPEMVTRLIEEGATGSKKSLSELSAQRVKEIGDELRSVLTGKEANYDDIVSQIQNFENNFASGEREGAKNALSKVLNEFEGLFKSGDDGAKTINLSDLNFEKSRLANSAKRLYDNPDLNTQALKKAQKEIADASRSVVYDQAPEAADLLNRYHAYDALGDSIAQISEKQAAKPLTTMSMSDIGTGAAGAGALGLEGGVTALAVKKALETTPVQTKAASFLYNLLNKAKRANVDNVFPVTGIADQAVTNFIRNEN